MNIVRELVGGVEAGKIDRRVVGVVPVDEDDAAEAHLREGHDQVLNHRDERRSAEVCETFESSVDTRKAVRHGRGYEAVHHLGDASADLAGNDHVGSKRGVRTVLLHRAGGNEHQVAPL
jgi:hypothetical protein